MCFDGGIFSQNIRETNSQFLLGLVVLNVGGMLDDKYVLNLGKYRVSDFGQSAGDNFRNHHYASQSATSARYLGGGPGVLGMVYVCLCRLCNFCVAHGGCICHQITDSLDGLVIASRLSGGHEGVVVSLPHISSRSAILAYRSEFI